MFFDGSHGPRQSISRGCRHFAAPEADHSVRRRSGPSYDVMRRRAGADRQIRSLPSVVAGSNTSRAEWDRPRLHFGGLTVEPGREICAWVDRHIAGTGAVATICLCLGQQ